MAFVLTFAHFHCILSPRKPDDDSDEEDFYIQELDEESSPSPPSPPTLSHRDMARPPHEDPEYQRQIVGNYRQGLLSLTQTSIKPPLPTSANNLSNAGILHQTVANTLLHHSYSWSQASPVSFFRGKLKKKLFAIIAILIYRHHHKNTYVCHHARPHHMPHIHRPHTRP